MIFKEHAFDMFRWERRNTIGIEGIGEVNWQLGDNDVLFVGELPTGCAEVPHRGSDEARGGRAFMIVSASTLRTREGGPSCGVSACGPPVVGFCKWPRVRLRWRPCRAPAGHSITRRGRFI